MNDWVKRWGFQTPKNGRFFIIFALILFPNIIFENIFINSPKDNLIFFKRSKNEVFPLDGSSQLNSENKSNDINPRLIPQKVQSIQEGSQTYFEEIILQDSFEDLDIWEVTNPSIMSLNTSFGNPAPSVEIISTQADLGLCQYEEVFFPSLEAGEFIRIAIDVYIPVVQTGSMSIFTDLTGTKFPFRLRIFDTNRVHFYIYSTGQETTPSYDFLPNKWYKFAVEINNDQFTLAVNGTILTSIASSSYQSKNVPIAFGDGTSSIPEQGHYFFDNVKVSKIIKPVIFIYSTDSIGVYHRDKFNNETKDLLENLGFCVIVEDRSTIPTLNSSHFTNISQLWIMNGGDGSTLSESEQNLILGTWRNGTSIVLAGDETGWYTNVNLIGKAFGVEFEGAYAFSNPQTPTFIDHPIWINVSTIYADPTLPRLIIYLNSSAKALSTDSGHNQHVLFENETGTVFWGSSFGNFLDEHIDKYNNIKYISNLARYLQEPQIYLTNAENNSILPFQTELDFEVINFLSGTYQWNNELNQSFSSPFKIIFPFSSGTHLLTVNLIDYRNRLSTYTFNFSVNLLGTLSSPGIYLHVVNATYHPVSSVWGYIKYVNGPILEPWFTTNESGLAKLTGISTGNYSIKIEKYIDFPESYRLSGTFPLKINASDEFCLLEFRIQNAVLVEILDPLSNPISGLTLTAYDSTYYSKQSMGVLTDSFGRAIIGVPRDTDKIKIAIEDRNYTIWTESLSAGHLRKYSLIYDPNAPKISINVRNDQYGILSNKKIFLYSDQYEFLGLESRTDTNGWGTFYNVTQGKYRVKIEYRRSGSYYYFYWSDILNSSESQSFYVNLDDLMQAPLINWGMELIMQLDPSSSYGVGKTCLKEGDPLTLDLSIEIGSSDSDYDEITLNYTFLCESSLDGMIFNESSTNTLTDNWWNSPSILLNESEFTTGIHNMNLSCEVKYICYKDSNIVIIDRFLLEQSFDLEVLPPFVHQSIDFPIYTPFDQSRILDLETRIDNQGFQHLAFLEYQYIYNDPNASLFVYYIVQNSSTLTKNHVWNTTIPIISNFKQEEHKYAISLELDELYTPNIVWNYFHKHSNVSYMNEIYCSNLHFASYESASWDITTLTSNKVTYTQNTANYIQDIFPTLHIDQDNQKYVIWTRIIGKIDENERKGEAGNVYFGKQTSGWEMNSLTNNIPYPDFHEADVKILSTSIDLDTEHIPYIAWIQASGWGDNSIKLMKKESGVWNEILDKNFNNQESQENLRLFCDENDNVQIISCGESQAKHFLSTNELTWLEETIELINYFEPDPWTLDASINMKQEINFVLIGEEQSSPNENVLFYFNYHNDLDPKWKFTQIESTTALIQLLDITFTHDGNPRITFLKNDYDLDHDFVTYELLYSPIIRISLSFGSNVILPNTAIPVELFLNQNYTKRYFWDENTPVTFKESDTIYSPVTHGWHNLTLGLNATNQEYRECFPFFVDAKPPEIATVSSVNNSFIQIGSDLVITLNEEYVDSVRYHWGDNIWVDSPKVLTIPVPQQEGDRTLTIYVNDSVGHSSEWELKYTINLPPRITSSSLMNRSIFLPQQLLDFNIEDNELISVTYSWNQDDFATLNTPYQIETPEVEAWYNLTIIANDSREGSTIKTYYLFIDNSYPTVVLSTPLNNSMIMVEHDIYLDITDPTLSVIVYYWNDQIYGTLSEALVDIKPETEGWHTLKIKANDSVGHVTTKKFNFYINHVPQIFLTIFTNNSAILPSTTIEFTISDDTLHEVWYHWDSEENQTLIDPYQVSTIKSTGWHTIILYANDSWGIFTYKRYFFYILGSASVDMGQTPLTVYSGEKYVYSFTIVNKELISLDLMLLIFGTNDEILKGNESQFLIASGESRIIELEFKPKHASPHQLFINLYQNGELYYQYTLEFNVRPQWESPRFYIPFIFLPIILFLLISLIMGISFYSIHTRKRVQQVSFEDYPLIKGSSFFAKIKRFFYARAAYKEARGTLHFQTLKVCRKNMNSNVNSQERRKTQLKGELQGIEYQKETALEKDLSKYLIRERLTDIDGIGPVIRDRIIYSNRINHLDDLHSAIRYVYGIGEVKQSAISNWARRQKQQFPSLLRGNFPGKRRIVELYDDKKRSINNRISNIDQNVNHIRSLDKQVVRELDWLKQIKQKHFRNIFQGDNEVIDQIKRYNNGIFPEFSPLPSWFDEIVSKFGKHQHNKILKSQYQGFLSIKEWEHAKDLGFRNKEEYDRIKNQGFRNKFDYNTSHQLGIVKAPEFYASYAIYKDKVIDKGQITKKIERIIETWTTPVKVSSLSKEYNVHIETIISILESLLSSGRSQGRIIGHIYVPELYIDQITSEIDTQTSGSLSKLLNKYRIDHQILEFAIEKLLDSNDSIFTLYFNSDQDIYAVIYKSEWNNIVQMLSTTEGFTPGTMFPLLNIYNWKNIFERQRHSVLSYKNQLFSIEGLQKYAVNNLDEIEYIIQHVRRQLPQLSLTAVVQREILQSFEQLIPIEPILLPYYCQMDSAMIVKEESAYVCVDCNRKICSKCYKGMRQAGMENCIYCGGELTEHPALQIEVDIERVDQMTGHEFENFLEGLFRTQMYRVENIQSSGDHGVDLVVVKGEIRTGVQAKRYKPSSKIRNQVLVMLKGGGYFHDCDKLMVVTTSYFTPKAKEYAKKVDIELWDRNVLRRYLTKYNEHLQRED